MRAKSLFHFCAVATTLAVSGAFAQEAPLQAALSEPVETPSGLTIPALVDVPTSARSLAFQLPFAYGACFTVTQGNNGAFSHHERSNRYAWDFNLPMGTPVTAAAAGRVVLVPEANEGIGKSIVLDHGSGYYTLYAHLSKLKASPGQVVQAGQTIALSGRDTGVSPHLHFGVFTLLPSLTSLPARMGDNRTDADGVPRARARYCARGGTKPARPSDTALRADAFISQGITLKTAAPAHALVIGETYHLQGVSARPFAAVFYQVRTPEGLILTNNATYSDERGNFTFEIETPLGRAGEPVEQVLFSDLARQGSTVSTVVLVER